NAIEFADTGRQAGVRFDLDVRVEPRTGARAGDRVAMTRRRRAAALLRALLDERVPGAAVGTFTEPLRGLRSALLADVHGRRLLRHDAIIPSSRTINAEHAEAAEKDFPWFSEFRVDRRVRRTRARCGSRCGRESRTGSCRSARRSRGHLYDLSAGT